MVNQKKNLRKLIQLLKKKINNFNRQALHAKNLAFIHPSSEKEIFFEAERPEDLDVLIKSLNKASL